MRSRGAWAAAALALGAGLGAIAFFVNLAVPSASGDEVTYLRAAQAYVSGDFAMNPEHPPLGKWMLAAGGWWGESLTAFRVVGAVLGWLTALLLAGAAWVITRRLWVAILVAWLWWLLPVATGLVRFHVARSVLLEAPLMFWMAAGLLALALSARDTRRRWWLVVALCAGLAGACKLPGLVLLAGLVPLGWARWRTSPSGARLRSFGEIALLGLGCGAVAATAFAATYLPAGDEAVGWLRETFAFQFAHAASGHVQTVAGVNYAHPPWWAPFWFQAQYLSWPATLALWGAAILGLVRHRRFPVTWALAAVLVVSVLALTGSPLKLPQYHTLVVPTLVLAAGLSVIPARPTAEPALAQRSSVRVLSPTTGVALVAMAVLLVRGGANVGAVVAAEEQDYAAAAAVILAGHPTTTEIALWGDHLAATHHLPGYRVSSRYVEEDPDVFLVDLTFESRRESMDLAGWLTRNGEAYERRDFEHVVLLQRRD